MLVTPKAGTPIGVYPSVEIGEGAIWREGQYRIEYKKDVLRNDFEITCQISNESVGPETCRAVVRKLWPRLPNGQALAIQKARYG